MWEHGTFIIDDIEFIYDAKVFDKGSRFGINNGRISKLSVWKGVSEELCSLDNLIINYDRDWDIRPRPCDKLDRRALEYILNLYPIV